MLHSQNTEYTLFGIFGPFVWRPIVLESPIVFKCQNLVFVNEIVI